MFLNIIFSIGFTFVVFHSHKPTGSTNQPEAQTNRKHSYPLSIKRRPDRQKSSAIINKKIKKKVVHVHL